MARLGGVCDVAVAVGFGVLHRFEALRETLRSPLPAGWGDASVSEPAHGPLVFGRFAAFRCPKMLPRMRVGMCSGWVCQ